MQTFGAILKRSGLRQRLKTSSIYDLYWTIADTRRIAGRSKEVDFYRKLLAGFRPGDLIFDIGANDGQKTDIFLRLGARVLAVEPDEVNCRVIYNRFMKYRLAPKPVVIVDKAVSDRNAVETIWIDGAGSALNTLSQKWVETVQRDKGRFAHTTDRLEFAQRREIGTTTLEQLVAAHGLPFYVKIDVEGYEINVVRGLRRPVPYLSYEVNLPEFRPEGLECIELLTRLDGEGRFNYAVDVRDGLFLQEWLEPPEFSRVLAQYPGQTIEVFWKTFHTPK
jgi:FkbM family methyltransferase